MDRGGGGERGRLGDEETRKRDTDGGGEGDGRDEGNDERYWVISPPSSITLLVLNRAGVGCGQDRVWLGVSGGRWVDGRHVAEQGTLRGGEGRDGHVYSPQGPAGTRARVSQSPAAALL